jgi:tetratricopeptide (TPR) repeat protein
MHSWKRAVAMAAIAAVVLAVPAVAGPTGEAKLLPGMGEYSHPINTSNPEAQTFFDQGLALLYNFNHAEAERSFRKAAALDPKAPMPWWGVGVALGLNYNRDVAKLEGERLQGAYEAAQRALELSRGGWPTEAALAEALATRYSLDPAADHDVLNRRYSDAMRVAYHRFPDDPEIAVMYADAIMNLRPWQLWKTDGTPEEGTAELVQVLERVLRRFPDHPGANHYYIHAVEASKTPERALASAQRLESLVPGAGHLVHMPTHIYIHTGHIDRIADLNARAAEADEKYLEIARPQGIYEMYYGHNVHFVVVGNILTGRYEEAVEHGEKLARLFAPHVDHMPEMTEWTQAMPLMAHIRFHRWQTILDAPRPDAAARPLLAAFDAYARALAYGMTGNAGKASREAESFERIRATVPEDRRIVVWNSGVEVLEMVSHLLKGQLATDPDEAVRHLEIAATRQDAFTYDEPEPWPWSVRETLGAVLLKAGRATDAEKVFRHDLELNPRSGRALFGLAKSLEAQGRHAEAAAVQREADAAWARATSPLTVEGLF